MKVGMQGEIIIPKKFQKKYGLLPNIGIELVPDTEGVQVKRKDRLISPVKRVFGILKKRNISTDVYIDKIRGK